MRCSGPLLLALSLSACNGDRGGGDTRERLAAVEAQLTAARNDLMKLRKRIDELEADAPAAAPADPAERPSAIAAELPRVPAEGIDADATTSVLAITATELRLDGSTIADADLEDRLRERARKDPSRAVILQASEEVPFARLVELLDRVKAAGITRFSIATEADDSPPTR